MIRWLQEYPSPVLLCFESQTTSAPPYFMSGISFQIGGIGQEHSRFDFGVDSLAFGENMASGNTNNTTSMCVYVFECISNCLEVDNGPNLIYFTRLPTSWGHLLYPSGGHTNHGRLMHNSEILYSLVIGITPIHFSVALADSLRASVFEGPDDSSLHRGETCEFLAMQSILS